MNETNGTDRRTKPTSKNSKLLESDETRLGKAEAVATHESFDRLRRHLEGLLFITVPYVNWNPGGHRLTIDSSPNCSGYSAESAAFA